MKVPSWLTSNSGRRPDVIRHPAQDRPGDQLAERVGGHQQAHDGRGSAQFLGVKRQQRQDDGEPQNVDGNDQEDGEQRRFQQESQYDGNR